MFHPHTMFLVALGVVGPLLAMAGVSIGGAWAPLLVGLGGGVVAAASWRSTLHSYRDRRLHRFFRWRMMAVTGIVASAATMLVGGSIVWLALGL